MREGSTTAGSELFRLALDQCRSGMLAVDGSGSILLANREIERLFGYARDELIGMPIDVLVAGASRAKPPPEHAGELGAQTSTAMVYGRGLLGLRKDGSEVAIDIEVTPVRLDSGNVVLASVADASAQQRSEDQLRQSQKMEAIGTLAGGIAHDFNNILLSIMGHAELAKSACADRQVQADLDQVLGSAERGQLLVQRILTFSRQRKVTRVPLKPERTIAEALQLLRASLPTTIAIRGRLDPYTPKVLSDETQLHQVVLALASNAADAMPNGGVLDVCLAPCMVDAQVAERHPKLRLGLHARLSVTDSGHGMDEEVLHRVFEPFFTTRQRSQGTGLGLSVVHGILHSHGGAIELHSRPHEGTRVDVYLPAYEAQAPVDARTPARFETPHTQRILLVEDEASLAQMLERQLSALGYAVSAYTESLEALEAFQSAPDAFDLLVTDNTMPKLSGIGLATEVLRKRSKLPVLLISGLAETFDAAELLACGITRILPKPHTSRQLEGVIAELLSGPRP